MYEELKQEIRDVVKPNFRQQINGQNLQDVLIDMVDNYPAVSGSEELNDLIAKSGSWDNAADWVTNNSGSLVTSESLAPVVEDLKDEIAEIGDTYATTASVNTLSASLDERINNIITGSGVDLSGYATTASVNAATESVKEWVEDKHYLTEHQDISGLATTASVNSLSESVANDFTNLDIPDVSGLATTASLNSLSSSVRTMSASFDRRINSITGSADSLWAKGLGTGSVFLPNPNTVNPALGDYSVVIGKFTEARGDHAFAQGRESNAWGAFSHAEGDYTTASADWSHAEGHGTKALGDWSHAEGRLSRAGQYSHAEGYDTAATGYAAHSEGSRSLADYWYAHAEGCETTASGWGAHAEGTGSVAQGTSSHAEGDHTIATNYGEHAQGKYNATASGQIFSIGCGYPQIAESVPELRRNAISIIPNYYRVPKVYVYGVGGYDGTNPREGVNDLAKVIGDLSGSTAVTALSQSVNSLSQSVISLSESVNTTSASFDQRINDITGSGGGGDYLPLAGGTLTGNLQVNASVGVGTAPGGTNCLVVGSSGTEANGAHNSVVVGEDCHASVWNAFAAGRENYVETNGAFGSVTGFRNRVNAMAGYAGGCRSTSSGEFATAIGFGAAANSKGQVVLGSYNELDPTGNRTSTGSYAVIFGIGKSSTWNQDDPGEVTRQNGLAIKWNGDIDINYSGSVVALQAKIAELEARLAALEGN